MNKKFSTLLTASLLMAGSAFNSAWADKLPISAAATALEDGKSYVLVQSNIAYGFASVNDEGKISETFVEDPTREDDVAPEMIPAYIWKVSISQVGTAYAYTFTNSLTGQVLRYNTTDGSEKIELDTNVAASKTSSTFEFGTYQAYSASNNKLIADKLTSHTGITTAYVGISNATGSNVMTVSVDEGYAVTIFYAVESQSVTTATELNTLYNKKGVSFEVNGKDVVGNIFADKRLEAYYLANAANIDAANDLKIPAGMYFFTDKVMDGNNIDWLNSSVLAVSSTETVEVTNADRAAGKGFEVVEVRIGDMNLYTGTTNAKKSSGSEISIYNAAFTVNKSYTSSYPYALTVDGFRYQKDASKDDHAAAKVRLDVLTHGGVNYLASQKADDPIYTFKKVATTAIKGIEFLNTDATVAAYGIRFLNGNANDVKTVYGKYLTIGADAAEAMLFTIADTVSPTANEAIEASQVTVIGGQGVVTVQGAAGKVITVANILGQTIANQVAASDNVTIAAPAGVVVVAVEGEVTKVVVK